MLHITSRLHIGRRSFKKYTISRKSSKESGDSKKKSRKVDKIGCEEHLEQPPENYQQRLEQQETKQTLKETILDEKNINVKLFEDKIGNGKEGTHQQQKRQQHIYLDEEYCKKKIGYLVKSPSKICFRNKIARWHLRWFVLYDNQSRCGERKIETTTTATNSREERVVELLYYKNHREEQMNSQPLGKNKTILN